MIAVVATFSGALSHYLLALKDHMNYPKPAPVRGIHTSKQTIYILYMCVLISGVGEAPVET